MSSEESVRLLRDVRKNLSVICLSSILSLKKNIRFGVRQNEV